jgi:CubicO group peptidase (beta-lactamase class C family)
MLVDEGRVQWDDPIEKYLPEFTLKVQSKDPNESAHRRDAALGQSGQTMNL